MDEHELPEGSRDQFHRVIELHGNSDLDWDSLSQEIPFLPRGWFELSRLPQQDRVEFTRDYWLSKFEDFDPHTLEQIEHFFSTLDDVGLFATQIKQDQPFDVHMVYNLKGNIGFFHGYPPAGEKKIENLITMFGPVEFPADYLAFLHIHDGFSKYTDTGVIKTKNMVRTYQRFQNRLSNLHLFSVTGEVINPASLIPFYEDAMLHSYQCFYIDWTPSDGMGNVYFSEEEPQISLGTDPLEIHLAFPNFLDWLVHYLEDIWQV